MAQAKPIPEGFHEEVVSDHFPSTAGPKLGPIPSVIDAMLPAGVVTLGGETVSPPAIVDQL